MHKQFYKFLLIILSVLTITACSIEENTTKKTLNHYFEGIVSGKNLVYQSSTALLPKPSVTNKLFSKNLTYKIISVKQTENAATAVVEITQLNLKKLYRSYFFEVNQLRLAKKDTSGKRAEIFNSLANSSEFTLVKSKVSIDLTQKNNRWNISLNPKLQDALLGGILVEYKRLQKDEVMMQTTSTITPKDAHTIIESYEFLSETLWGNAIIPVYNHFSNTLPSSDINKTILNFDNALGELKQIDGTIQRLDDTNNEQFKYIWSQVIVEVNLLKIDFAKQLEIMNNGGRFNPDLSLTKWYMDLYHELIDIHKLDATHAHH